MGKDILPVQGELAPTVLRPAIARLLGEPVSVPFVIRETRRKFQHTLSEVSVWERL